MRDAGRRIGRERCAGEPAQPATPTAATPTAATPTAATKTALATKSIPTAAVGPTRSRIAPATGLTISPGAIAANVSHPAHSGDENRVSTKSTSVRTNIRPARREKIAATSSGGKPGMFSSER
ncbi:hypothetical protein BTI_5630 [Burkholderia thailandensis MSMB121]|uniref:hypothetical protein n=1 Tax=Burkholderia humptydooensis TaxID=430531 RepID=UPI00032802B3|nr:hypothetical protein [Burkholderia humptydooensis]AGK50074.1 hypothetical protein BTI_5630 [Burkholderia thailandensis MSMB121]ATF32966.1 hypothetical protein CO709_06060 [Burkholderia thailandensis]KST70860.1 hypothetical protein WS76_19755 [Burkholderia humptydooensis]